MVNGCFLLPGTEFSVSVNNKGLWPNLTVLPNGEIVAVFYDHPNHGFGNGDVEMYVSTDWGCLWTYHSTVSDHHDRPEVVRMNHALGITGETNWLSWSAAGDC